MAVGHRPKIPCWINIAGGTEQVRVLFTRISACNDGDKTMPVYVSVNRDPVHFHRYASEPKQEVQFAIEIK